MPNDRDALRYVLQRGRRMRADMPRRRALHDDMRSRREVMHASLQRNELVMQSRVSARHDP